LGIGDWAQSPIPNPQSPIPKSVFIIKKYYNNIYILFINNYKIKNLTINV